MAHAGPIMAVSGRPLGAILAAYFFAPQHKSRDLETVVRPKASIEINYARAARQTDSIHGWEGNLTNACSRPMGRCW